MSSTFQRLLDRSAVPRSFSALYANLLEPGSINLFVSFSYHLFLALENMSSVLSLSSPQSLESLPLSLYTALLRSTIFLMSSSTQGSSVERFLKVFHGMVLSAISFNLVCMFSASSDGSSPSRPPQSKWFISSTQATTFSSRKVLPLVTTQ